MRRVGGGVGADFKADHHGRLLLCRPSEGSRRSSTSRVGRRAASLVDASDGRRQRGIAKDCHPESQGAFLCASVSPGMRLVL